MAHVSIPLRKTDLDYIGQVRYAMTFLSEDIVSYDVDEKLNAVNIELRSGADVGEIQRRVDQLLRRYDQAEFGFKSMVYFDRRRKLQPIDAWRGMLDRRWVTPVGEGHVILRGLAARLMTVVNRKIDEMFADEFGADYEVFPSTIKSETLDRCNHFTSFPEHMDFVAHFKQDMAVLKHFSDACREQHWSASLHDGNMAAHDFAISPSCCYHAYEGMEGWQLEKPGRCITAALNCHRYEGASHQTLMRLRSFTMREVIWVGQPSYVLACRARAEHLIQQWASAWELSCTFETANDMFFTDDYAVKASFQRQQEAKRELRAEIPSENASISLFSSNFHSTTFGKAFNITVDAKPATSGCVGWGLERWVYALISQFGFDPQTWPARLRQEYETLTR